MIGRNHHLAITEFKIVIIHETIGFLFEFSNLKGIKIEQYFQKLCLFSSNYCSTACQGKVLTILTSIRDPVSFHLQTWLSQDQLSSQAAWQSQLNINHIHESQQLLGYKPMIIEKACRINNYYDNTCIYNLMHMHLSASAQNLRPLRTLTDAAMNCKTISTKYFTIQN